MPLPFPVLECSNPAVERAYRIAMGDILANIRPFKDGLLAQPEACILAGLDYNTPWTRDAAINVWNGLGLFYPQAARSTLLSVLERCPDGRIRIGGQYWDAIIWVLGAWADYLYTGEPDFLALAFEAARNSLERFEREELDPSTGFFRGPAVYGDGVAAYPDPYSPGGTSAILDWPQANPGLRVGSGYGIPMLALSTNCLYAQAYRVTPRMAAILGHDSAAALHEKGERLAGRIRAGFWNPEKGWFNYLIDPLGRCDHQEGLGHAFALLFAIADERQSEQVLDHQARTPFGIPCVYPTFARYAARGGYGRHSGTVWPFISGFWAEAALMRGRADLFAGEFLALTALLNRHGQCPEIVHPVTGEIYGGLQEAGRGEDGLSWDSCARQTWTASAYLRMILTGLLGMRFDSDGIRFKPALPGSVEMIRLSAFP
jgi:glycogen debranching enzyme